MIAASLVLMAWGPALDPTARAQLVPVRPPAGQQVLDEQRPDDPDERDDEASGGVAFPTDRRRERQLDQARRLINESRWSDVATLLDGILEADRDFFYQPAVGESTWRSVKSEAARLLADLPAAGREAYELQFRARAERALEQAVAANDPAGVVAVARRWFQTPAGRRATLVAAVESLEAGQPLAAAAGLDRLAMAADAAAFEPALSVLRAAALWRAGERTAATTVLDGARGRGAGVVRLAGREMPLSYPAGGATDWLAGVLGEPPVVAVRRAQEWWLSRGDSARNAIVESSRPLLVARYRVPLSRHPEESRLLERRRRQAADRDAAQWPAGGPLAVDGRLLVRSPLGLLAVDFATGKRVWLQPAGSTAAFLDNADEMEDGSGRDKVPASVRNVFEDATAGGLASDGRLVFAVEPDPVTVAAQVGQVQARFNGLMVPEDRIGNALAAYDVADRGRQVWRLPRKRADRDAGGRPPTDGLGNPGAGTDPPAGTTAGQYLGAPLPLGEQLFVIVEEKGEIRLDVLEAATGDTSWTQPLAVLDEELAGDGGIARQRRLAGLSPSFAEGVLVCPTGAGAVVAVDLANRTLLWAYGYTRPSAPEGMMLNNMRIRRGLNARIIVNGQLVTPGEAAPRSSGWRDVTAIVAGGRVIITPPDSDELHCVDLRTGSLVWRRPRGDACQVAGVAGDAVVVVHKHAVDIVALADGKSRLENPVTLGNASPSGRGVLTGSHLFLPLDTPEVVDIDLAQGQIVGRSPSRGGAVPGNLVAYRGEIISQGVDSLDVFHQSAALQEQLQTAAVGGAWGPVWAGQLALDSGDVANGLGMILRARQADPAAVPAAVVSDAMLFALGGQFQAAAPVWRESLAGVGAEIAATTAYSRQLRIACDGYLRAGDMANAWWACQETLALAERQAGAPRDDGPGLVEDPADRNLSSAGHLWLHGRIADLVAKAPPDIRAQIDRRVDASLAEVEAEPDPVIRSNRLEEFLGIFGSHPAAARARQRLIETLEARLETAGTGDTSRGLLLRAELLRAAGGSVSAADVAGAQPPPDTSRAWPLGRVVERTPANGRAGDASRHVRVVGVSVADGGRGAFPGLRLCYDMNNMRLFAVDGFGRRLGDLFDRSAVQLAGIINPLMLEATAVGRVVVIRSGSLLAAFELSGDPSVPNRRLWMLTDLSPAAAELPLVNVGRIVGVRGMRAAHVPLGMRVAEPDDPNPREELQLGPSRASGVPVRVGAALELHDPVTGTVIWERHRLPTNGDLFGDDDFLCITPPNGVGATVVSMADGRVIRTVDLPPRQQRLAIHGRRIVVIEPVAGGDAKQVQPRVRLVLLDPVSMERQPLGEYRGEALAAPVGERMVVLEPGGTLTLLDLGRGASEWTVRLPTGDDRPEELHVQAWEDRLLVFVGRQPTAEEQAVVARSGIVLPIPQSMVGEAQQPATGAVWAVSLRDGSPLWPAPATILQHALHSQQPVGLPVLVFARQIQGQRGGGQTRLSLLALDKRTGHAVCLDDGIETQQHLLLGFDVTADPAGHTITLGRGGGEVADRVLEFTGRPMAPRPPYQATAVQPPPLDLRGSLQRLLERALTPDGGP